MFVYKKQFKHIETKNGQIKSNMWIAEYFKLNCGTQIIFFFQV